MNAQVCLREYPNDNSRNEIKIDKIESLTSVDTTANEIETIRTYRVGGARGPLIAKTSYFSIADAILSFLLVKEEVSLVELIHYIEELNVKFRENTNWLLLQVKQDLEHKGFIKSFLKDKSPYINLMRKAFLRSEFKKALILQMDDKSRMSYLF